MWPNREGKADCIVQLGKTQRRNVLLIWLLSLIWLNLTIEFIVLKLGTKIQRKNIYIFCYFHFLSILRIKCLSVQFSSSGLSNYFRPHVLQHARLPCPSPTPGANSNSCPLSQTYHPTTSSSVVPFSSHLPSFPSSVSFQMSQLFPSGGQSIGVSTSTSVFPMNIQDRFPLWWTDWISLQSKGLSRVFSNITDQKHQLFGAQLSL